MKINVRGGETQRKKVNRASFKLAVRPLIHHKLTVPQISTLGRLITDVFHQKRVNFDKRQCSNLKNFQLAESFPRKTVTVHMLVGADQYYRLVQVQLNAERLLLLSPSWVGFLVIQFLEAVQNQNNLVRSLQARLMQNATQSVNP